MNISFSGHNINRAPGTVYGPLIHMISNAYLSIQMCLCVWYGVCLQVLFVPHHLLQFKSVCSEAGSTWAKHLIIYKSPRESRVPSINHHGQPCMLCTYHLVVRMYRHTKSDVVHSVYCLYCTCRPITRHTTTETRLGQLHSIAID